MTERKPQVQAGDHAPTPIRAESPSPPDPEVRERPTRRTYPAEYKLRILREVDACSHPGEIGSLLRREGLYSSILSTWRRQREKGVLKGLSPRKRGRKVKEENPLAKKLAQVEREKRVLERKLKRAEMLIELQKKVAALMEMTGDEVS